MSYLPEPRGNRTAPLQVKIRPGTRMALDEARDGSGRKLGAETDFLLRAAMGLKQVDQTLLLQLDDGLMAHLKASSAAWLDLAGELDDIVVFILRRWLTDQMTTEFYLRNVVPRLPEPYRSSCMAMPAYRALAS